MHFVVTGVLKCLNMSGLQGRLLLWAGRLQGADQEAGAGEDWGGAGGGEEGEAGTGRPRPCRGQCSNKMRLSGGQGVMSSGSQSFLNGRVQVSNCTLEKRLIKAFLSTFWKAKKIKMISQIFCIFVSATLLRDKLLKSSVNRCGIWLVNAENRGWA